MMRKNKFTLEVDTSLINDFVGPLMDLTFVKG